MVELVVVILLLGVLAAIALPRFIDVTDEAHVAVSEGIMGGFKTAIGMAHAQWRVEGEPSTIVLDGINIAINAEGWPEGATPDTAGCIDIWDTMSQAPEPIIAYPGLVPVDDWSTLRFGTACVFINHHGEAFNFATTPFFAYYPVTLGPALPAGHVQSFNF